MKFLRHIAVFGALLVWAGLARAENGRSMIPLTLTRGEHGGGRVYVPARIGNVMGTMRLDTGASTTRVALAPWNKDWPIVAQSASTGASGRTAVCQDVEAGNVELKASEGANIARAKYIVTRCDASDGDDLLGLDFFKGARFTLDFQRSELVFFGPANPARRPKPFRPLGPDRRLVGLDARLGGAAMVALFDSGAELSAVDRQFVDRHKKLFTPVSGDAARTSEAGGGQFSHRTYKINALDLGDGRVLRGVYAIAYDFGALRAALGGRTPLILGYNVLSQYKWDLDFQSPAPTWDARPAGH